MRIPKYRPPTHPGEMLLKEFLEPMQITQQALAQAIGVPYQRVNELINGKRGITPSTALRLSKFFGNSPDFWLNLQNAWELYHAQRAEAEQLEKIKPWALLTGNNN
ncbi:HigA family addiction module antidote protein [Pleurocapsales cyanobacterium LEGE 06147]|nr:HigA family addiction module antidote protein [Pleurocapsales cyanobacterium LEGE 06147]